MITAYQNAKTLRDVIELRVTGEPLDGLQNSHITIASDRSSGKKKIRVTKEAAGITSMAVTDGDVLYATRSSDPTHYLKLDSQSKSWELWGQSSFYVFPAINAMSPGLVILFGDRGFDGMIQDGMTSLSLGKPQIVGGAIAETLHATLIDKQKVETTITLVCFKSDGLLCRLDYNMTRHDNGIARNTRITEEHTKTVVNLPFTDSVFTFMPAQDATAVTKWD